MWLLSTKLSLVTQNSSHGSFKGNLHAVSGTTVHSTASGEGGRNVITINQIITCHRKFIPCSFKCNLPSVSETVYSTANGEKRDKCDHYQPNFTCHTKFIPYSFNGNLQAVSGTVHSTASEERREKYQPNNNSLHKLQSWVCTNMFTQWASYRQVGESRKKLSNFNSSYCSVCIKCPPHIKHAPPVHTEVVAQDWNGM